MDFDVFISYHTKSSLHITEAVCNELENRKIKCWYAPRNISGSYAKSIVDAINNCKVFLLILNKEASYSEDVLNEINLAVERVRKQEEMYIVPFHVSEDEISPDAKYYLGRIHWIDAINPPMEDRIRELSDRIAYILGKNIETIKTSSNSNDFALKSSHIVSSEYFIGRKREQEEIENILQENNVVALQGMGGIGKSELAKIYANSKKDEYDTVVFAVYEDSIKKMIVKDKYFIIEGLTRKTNPDGSEESDDSYYERKINALRKITTPKTLIIIDNFDTDKDENIGDILELPAKVIFTTRNDLKKYQIPKILINAFDNEEELFELFLKYYGVDIKNEEDKATIIDILKEVKGHTLAIQLLANLMSESRIRPQKILEKLRNKGLNNEITGEVNYHYKDFSSIYQCISCVFDLSTLTQDEKQILRYLSIFSNDGIEFETFMDICNLETGEIINKLIKKSLIQYNHVKDMISLHPVIRSVIQNELTVNYNDIEPMIEKVVSVYKWTLTQDTKRKYTSIIRSIYKAFPTITKENYKTYLGLVDFATDVCDFETAENLLYNIEKVADDNNYIAKVYDKIAYIFIKKGKYDEAIAYIDKDLVIAKEIKNYDCKLWLYQLKSFIGKYINDAQMCFENAKKMEELVLTKDETLPMSNVKYQLMAAYRMMKEYDKSLECADEAYKLFTKNGTFETGDVAGVYKEKGIVYMEMGDYKKAIENLLLSDEVKSKYFAEQDLRRLDGVEALADAYIKNGEIDKAKQLYIYIKETIEKYYCDVDEILDRINKKIAICTKLL